MKSFLAATLLVFVASGPALAHGIWLAERHGSQAVVYGHGAEDDAYDPRKLTRVSAYDRVGGEVPVTTNRQNDHVLLDLSRDVAVLTAEFDNGFWTKDKAGKWHNLPKAQVSDAVEDGRYVKYLVALTQESAYAAKAKGLPLEIRPLRDPMALRMGDRLVIQVLADGKPVAGAKVTGDYVNDGDNDGLVTDADGQVEITIRNDGLNVIATSLDIPTPKGEAQELGLFATLSFTLPHRH